MKAVRLYAYGGVDQLRYEEIPTPEPGPDEVLVKVAATSVNPIDWKIRSGAVQHRMPLKLPVILGRDLAGTVTKTGVNVRNLQSGQKVMGLVNGSYAEYLTARADHLTVIPDGLEMEQAAALPLVVTTGAQLIQHIAPKPGDVLLVTGALGNVGRSAVYLAKKLGARVLAGVKTGQKEQANSVGADEVVGIDDDKEIAALPELGAIADTVDQDVIGKLIAKLKPGGVLGSVLGKPKEAEAKDIRVEAFMVTADASLLRQMADAVRDGKLAIPVVKKMRLSEAGEAQALAEKGSLGGKILLIP
ncbi:MAG TPA: NADP-dependent oxidoreductase [Bryobacteraceae bacterium]|jgi:NADPH:quinone reductase-like Zn-dependent oxidoreductase|nr:NADP-dependent oxidoreductase [Bryobacteraceae bacterium]